MKDLDHTYLLLDRLMSEYGWSLEYCLKLPADVIKNLTGAIQERKNDEMKVWTKLIGLACATGFSGKLDQLDKILNKEKQPEEIDTDTWKSQVRSLWIKTKTNNKIISEEERKELIEQFEEEWAKGNSVEF